MIDVFENKTKELGEREILLAHDFAKAFNHRPFGEQHAILSTEIIAAYHAKGVKMNNSRIRKIIQYIRLNQLVMNLIGSQKGYHRSDDPIEIQKYIDRLDQRIILIQRIKKSFTQC
jgi:hypothetical protein